MTLTAGTTHRAVARLEVRGLSKTFSGVTVLDDASLALAPGEIHALVGQNGSGKSTLIKLISGVHRADPGGEILVDGVHLGPPVHAGRLHGQGLAFVHQDLGLVPDLSVRENVRVGLQRRRAAHPPRRQGRRPRRGAPDLRVPRRPDRPRGHRRLPDPQRAGRGGRRPRAAGARGGQRRHRLRRVLAGHPPRGPAGLLRHGPVPRRTRAPPSCSSATTSRRSWRWRTASPRCATGSVVETGVPVSDLDEAALTRLVLGRDGAPGDLIGQHPPRPTGTTVDIAGVRGGRVRDFTASLRGGEVVGVTGTIDSGLLDLPALLGGASPATGSDRGSTAPSSTSPEPRCSTCSRRRS